MRKKFEFTDETLNYGGTLLRRIRAVRSFGEVFAGDRGGWLENEHNLSHDGLAWVADEAQVFENACVYENAMVVDYAQVSGSARIFGDARIGGSSYALDNAKIHGNIKLYGDEIIYGEIELLCG